MSISHNFRNPSAYLRVFVSLKILGTAKIKKNNIYHINQCYNKQLTVFPAYLILIKRGCVWITAQNIASKHVNYKSPFLPILFQSHLCHGMNSKR